MKSMLRMSKWLWTTPPDAMLVAAQQEALGLHVLFALGERGLRFLSAPFASSVLELFHVLERSGLELAESLASGRLPASPSLSPEARARLERALGPQPARAREVRAALEQGMDGIALRLWPELAYVNSVTGGSFAIYARKLRRYVGDVPLCSSVYGATEALIGVGLRPEMTTYAVTTDSAYLELIPSAQVDQPSPQTVGIEDGVEGESYEIVLTNLSGLYRYRLGDMVRVVGRYHRTPVIEFLYRRGQLLNVVGEKTSEEAVTRAVVEAVGQWGMSLVDFTTLPDYEASPGRYVVFIEVDDPPALARLPGAPSMLEEALFRTSPRYQANRQAGKLGPLALHAVRSGTFREVRALLIRQGASPNQVKIPRVASAAELVRLLLEASLRG